MSDDDDDDDSGTRIRFHYQTVGQDHEASKAHHLELLEYQVDSDENDNAPKDALRQNCITALRKLCNQVSLVRIVEENDVCVLSRYFLCRQADALTHLSFCCLQ